MIQTLQRNRYQLGMALLIALVALTVLTLASTGGLAQDDNETETNQTENETHRLVVETENESVAYTITASSPVTLEENEEADAIQDDRTANGRVGGTPWDNETDDTRDVILYKGKIESFQYTGEDIVTTLDGEEIDPDEIGGEDPEPVTDENATETPNATDSNGTINAQPNETENNSTPVVNESKTDDENTTENATEETTDADRQEENSTSKADDQPSVNKTEAPSGDGGSFQTFLIGLAAGVVGIVAVVASVVIVIRQ